MNKYTTVCIGLGNRGQIQLEAFLRIPERFEVAGICDKDRERVRAAGEKFGISDDKWYTDAEEMLANIRPEVMSFATMPDVRLELVELGARYGIKGLIFEKPMAASLEEAAKIVQVCEKAGIKAIVCQQHKFLRSFRELKGVIDKGQIGEIQRITGECQSQMANIATHYIDYIMWANNGSKPLSVIGHVHGSSSLKGTHASPDYALGMFIMENGVRATLECGYMSRRHQEHMADYEADIYPDDYWTDCMLTVYGDRGFVYAGTNGQFGVVSEKTGGKLESRQYTEFNMDPEPMLLFTGAFAEWMDDDQKVHPSNVWQAYTGFEVFESIYISALDHVRVDLPLALPLEQDPVERMKEVLPNIPRRRFVK